jgi:hypothetical protein
MMLIEAAYPKRLETPQRRTIETEETSAPADSMTSFADAPLRASSMSQAGALCLVAASCA